MTKIKEIIENFRLNHEVMGIEKKDINLFFLLYKTYT